MTRFLIWAAPLLVVATPAFAQQASTETAAAAPAAAPAPAAVVVKPKKVCRTSTMTGRRIAQSRCYTAEQWADYDRTQNEAAKKLVNDVSSAGGKSDLGVGASGDLSTSSLFGLGPH